jgi:hypothetical protein
VKLGILVVYLVSDRMGPLLDLHLRKIEECTDVPYTIYGSVNRLGPRYRSVLDGRQDVKTFHISPAYEEGEESQRYVKGLIGRVAATENGYYLDRLVELAMADGVTHLCTLHVDSFPVRPGWVEHLLEKTRDSVPVAGMLRAENGDTMLPMPACLFSTREFIEAARPRFEITPETEASPDWPPFLERYREEFDTGFGYAFALHRLGLGFAPLRRSNLRNDHYLFAGIYDDVVFHLGAAARIDEGDPRVVFRGEWRGEGRTSEHDAARTFAERQRLTAASDLENRRTFEAIWERLVRDPDAYIESLRSGPGGT